MEGYPKMLKQLPLGCELMDDLMFPLFLNYFMITCITSEIRKK